MKDMPYFVYILACYRKNTFSNYYTGYTNNLKRRISQHRNNVAKQNRKTYTGRFDKIEILYYEEFETRSDAVKREKEIKRMSTKTKQNLIKTFNGKLAS